MNHFYIIILFMQLSQQSKLIQIQFQHRNLNSIINMQYIDENSPQIINQGYKIWKKNTPILYNILQSYELQSCSQTVQWTTESFIENNWRCMNLFIGTNSITNNAVYQLNVYLPTNQADVNYADYSEAKPQQIPGSPGYVGTIGQQNLSIKNTLHQDSEVMKVRVTKAHKDKENLVAIKTGGSVPQLFIYDMNHQEAELDNRKVQLLGHESEGYGLSWNNVEWNILASCSYDKKIIVWDVNRPGKDILPLKQIKTPELCEDIKWMHGNPNVFAVGFQNKQISLYDIRENSLKPSLTKTAHNGEIYALDFNQFAQNLLLSGDENNDIFLWDIRNMSKKFNSFIGHNDYITSLQWSNYKETQFVSGSADRRIVMWDISQIGTEITEGQKQQLNKTEEIAFIHGGHRSKITDLGFSAEHNVIASCEENNALQVWQMSQAFAGKWKGGKQN